MTHDGRSRRRIGVLVAFPVLASLALSAAVGDRQAARAASSPSYEVTITTRLAASGLGTFVLRGGLVDAGRASALRAVVNRRLNATVTLTGTKGRIVLTSQQRCDVRAGTWRIVSGTLAYAGVAGKGTTVGRIGCARPFPRATIVHRGTADVPPVALARPGAWGGTTAQGSVITFTVTPDGRAVTGVLATRYRYECVRSDGQRSTAFSATQSRHAGPFPIAEDRTFTLKTNGGTIAGRFGGSGAGAEGTITIAHMLPPNIQGQTSTCSASIPWTATNPPAPPPRALAGTYCGFTAAGGGVCVDVTASGREVRNLRAEIKLSCGLIARIPVSVPVTYDRPIPFAVDLSFRQSFDHAFEGRTLSASVSGTFDENGGLTGAVGVSPFTIERDGATHLCRSNGGFTARLQR